MAPGPSPRPAPASSSTMPVQSGSAEDLVTLSQDVFASLESSKAISPAESSLTPAQKQRTEIIRQEAIRRQNERLKQHGNDLPSM